MNLVDDIRHLDICRIVATSSHCSLRLSVINKTLKTWLFIGNATSCKRAKKHITQVDLGLMDYHINYFCKLISYLQTDLQMDIGICQIAITTENQVT